MFGYVTPCKMELKVKDYEKFKAYYCGLCKSIKKNFGNIPRFALNFDITFLAILLDSLSEDRNTFTKEICMVHPLKKKLTIINNEALNYSAFCNVLLAYYKLLDDVQDDNDIKGKIGSKILDKYIRGNDNDLEFVRLGVKTRLEDLQLIEVSPCTYNLDELSHPFADLTGFLISSYYKDKSFKDTLYWLGYNLGKWIYIIDAYDDLEKDMAKSKFNAINESLNNGNLNFLEFSHSIEKRIEFSLINCGKACLEALNNLPLVKNIDILENVLHFGLMEKIDKVFKRSDNNERSI
ncbi:MAG: DUF5685 family protein [Clostridium sp.]